MTLLITSFASTSEHVLRLDGTLNAWGPLGIYGAELLLVISNLVSEILREALHMLRCERIGDALLAGEHRHHEKLLRERGGDIFAELLWDLAQIDRHRKKLLDNNESSHAQDTWQRFIDENEVLLKCGALSER